MAVLTMATRARVLAVMMILLTAACRGGLEQWGPFRGRVVDADTGSAIQGAHVMVLWVREPPSLHLTQRFYDAQETTTDREGRFEIPRRSRVLTAFVGRPELSVFAAGYQMQAPRVERGVGRLYIDPTAVPMRLLKTRQERCDGLRLWRGPSVRVTPALRFMAALRDYAMDQDCRWPEGW